MLMNFISLLVLSIVQTKTAIKFEKKIDWEFLEEKFSVTQNKYKC